MPIHTGEERDLLAGCSGRSLSGLTWMNEPAGWEYTDSGLYIEPDGHTDMFRKYGAPPRDDACFLFTEIANDFSLLACLKVDGAGFGDAGGIAIRHDAERWAKLCIERSPLGEVSIVSVVTNHWSDDANNEVLREPVASLRITRIGNLIGMHYRVENAWRFVRAFGVDWPATLTVGELAQAPFAAGCKVYCTALSLSPKTVTDFRSGA